MSVSAIPLAPKPTGPADGRRVVLFRPLDSGEVPAHWNPEWAGTDAFGRRTRTGVGTSSAAFLSAISGHGWTISDIAIAAATHEDGLFRLRFPRDVSWPSLPIVGDPVIEHDLLSHPFTAEGQATDDADAPTWPALADTVEAVIVDSPRLDDLVFWHAIGPYRDEIASRGIRVHWFDGSRMSEIGRAEIEVRAGRMRTRYRLAWNFSLNFTVLASRAIASVAVEDGWSKSRFRSRMPKLDGGTWQAFGPLAVQMLYALDRLRVVEAAPWRPDIKRHWNGLLRACPWISVTETGLPVFEWRGSGRHAPLVCEVQRPDGFARDIEGLEVWRALVNLDIEGLTAVDADGRMGITAYGRKVIGKLGRSLEDPDVVLRWRAVGDDGVPAVDRWLNRAFRAMKRRVAPLPASPFVEVAGGEEARHARTGHRLVYGGYVRLGSEAMRDPAVVDAVAQVLAGQRDLPTDQRRIGEIQSDRHHPPEHPEFLWLGVPVGVAHEVCVRHGMVGWYCGLERFSVEVASIAASLPPALRPLVGDEFDRIMSVEEVAHATGGECLTPNVAAPIRWKARRVIVGWVGTVDDLAGLGRYGRWSFGVVNMRMEPFGGGISLSVQGAAKVGGGGVTWQGQEVGFLEGDGNLVPATTDLGRLERHVVREVGRDRDNLAVSDVPMDGPMRLGAWVVESGKAAIPYEGGEPLVEAVLAAARAEAARFPKA